MPVAETLRVQVAFDEAARQRVSPCAWLPPTWDELVANDNKFPATPPDLPKFQNPAAWNPTAKQRLDEGKEIDKKPVDAPQMVPSKEAGKRTWTSPYGDFTHVDDTEFPNADLTLAATVLDPGPVDPRLTAGLRVLNEHRDAIIADIKNKHAEQRFVAILNVLEGIAPGGSPTVQEIVKDFEGGPIFSAITHVLEPTPGSTPSPGMKAFVNLRDALRQMNPINSVSKQNAVFRLRSLVGPETVGMKRLERTFDWILYRATELLGDLNDAKDKDEAAYMEARHNYIAFLNDLDDHEPQKSGQRLDPRGEDPSKPNGPKKKLRKSGYGMTIKWNCVQPVIPATGKNAGKIVGTRVVVQWNPHSSSNGVPVDHP